MRLDDEIQGVSHTMSIFPTKILLATDGSDDAQLAATTVAGLANATDSELHVANIAVVAPALLAPLDVGPARVEQEARTILEEQLKKIENVGGAVAQNHVRMGDAAKEVVDLAEEIGVGLIAIGSRGRGGIRRALMGSVSASVVRHAHCAVMVVRGKPVVFPTKILLATDGSEEANLAARTAADLSQRTGSELQIVSVAFEYPYVYEAYYNVGRTEEIEQARQEAQKVLEEQTRRISEFGGNVAEAHLRVGAVDEEIILLAEEIGVGMIVMGSRGLGGIRRALMGSVSSSVVPYAHCPVLIVRE
jgi:nucleotide-binding universal stress UspA family protein